jgi:hypothetical protein
MNVKEIVVQYLRENGYDGLFSYGCGCAVDDLMPCCEDTSLCEAGFRKGVGCHDLDGDAWEWARTRAELELGTKEPEPASATDVRTCIMISEPCPVCGCTDGVECSADFIGEEDYRHWACGRREERWPGKDWQVTRECGGCVGHNE